MSVQNEIMLAQPLRLFLVENAPLPVKPGQFNLDGLLPKGPSMSLQISGSDTVRIYINGSKTVRLFFNILYRDEIIGNEDKSAMLGSLDSLGLWMEELMQGQEKPYLGDWLEVTQLEINQHANILTQDEKSITYQAGYLLGYRTKK